MGKLLLVSLIVFSQLFSQELKENDQSDNSWSIYGGIVSMGGSGLDALQGYDSARTGRNDSSTISFEFGVIKAVSEKIDVGVGYTQRGWNTTYERIGYYDDYDYDEDWSASAFEFWATYDLIDFENDLSFWIGSSYAILSTIEKSAQANDDGYVDNDSDNEFDIDNDFSLMFGITLPAGSDGIALKAGYQTSITDINITNSDSNYSFEDGFKFNQFFVNLTYNLILMRR